ncbi:MAG: phosphoribosylanthranilate isomerase [Candidatus Adiutrix sp.]|nr:phosphoribosylanthranilate isomerase [Candidatus Adiutrix sp.]
MSCQAKICGLTRPADAAFCAQAGAWAVGFIFHPASPRQVSPAEAAGCETGPARRVGVFIQQSPAEILEIMSQARLHLAQLHGGQDQKFCRAVGPERVIKVFWPQRFTTPGDLAEELNRYEGQARFFLLDAGASGGGHGRPLDFDFLRSLTPPRPWLLAGGLTPALAAQARALRLPGLWGFDFNSGLERSPGIKDHNLVSEALAALQTGRDDI